MNNTLKKLLAISLGVSPVFLMAFLFNRYAVNIPHWDDHALKGFILSLDFAKSFSEKLELFFAFHNEHRIVFTRFVTWLIVKFNGTIDYRIMMIVGNASLLAIWAFFIVCVNKYRLSAWYISISGWFLFSLAISENFFWGMAAVSNFWVLLWAISTFYLLIFGNQRDIRNPFVKNSLNYTVKPTIFGGHARLAGAVFTSWLALFTLGNGIIVPIIGLLILLIQRQFRSSLIWILTAFAAVALYYFTYEARPDKVNEASEVTFTHFLTGIITLAGAIFDADWAFPSKRILIAQLFGGILLFTSATLFLRRLLVSYQPKDNQYIVQKRKTDLFMSAFILFICGTMAGVVLNRSGYGLDVFITGKYKIYSILLLIVCTLYLGRLLQKKYRRIGLTAAVLLSIGLWVNSYFNDYQFVQNQYMQRRVDLANWKIEEEAKGDSLSQYPYKPPKIVLFENIDFSKYHVNNSLIDDIKMTEDEVIFIENDLEAVNNQVFFILKSNTKKYYFSTKPRRNKSRVGIFANYFQKGFTVNVSRFDVETNVYQPYAFIKTKAGEELIATEKLIRIEGIKQPERKINW